MKETLPENVSRVDPFNTRNLVLENKIAFRLLSGLKINELQVATHLVDHDIMTHEQHFAR